MLVFDVPKQYDGKVLQGIGDRRGELIKMDTKGNDSHMEFSMPARGLIGLRTRLLNATAGEAIMHHTFHDYELLRGGLPGRQNGVLISMEKGTANAYAL